MTIRDDTVAELERLGFHRTACINGRDLYCLGHLKVKLPVSGMTSAQAASILEAAHGNTRKPNRKRAADARREAADRKAAEARAAIEAEILRRDDAVFGSIGKHLTGADKRAIRRQLLEQDASRTAFEHFMTEHISVDDRAKHRA